MEQASQERSPSSFLTSACRFEDSTVRILNLGGREGTGSTRFLKHHLGSVWTVCMSHWLPKLLSAGKTAISNAKQNGVENCFYLGSDGSVHVLNTQSAEPEGRVHAIAHEHTADAAAPTSVYRFLLPPLINYTPVEPTGVRGRTRFFSSLLMALTL